MLNYLSVDTEDYYHAASLEPVINRAQWLSTEPRIEQSVERILQLFANHSLRATFFVLGVVAKRHPSLVKIIAQAGHEIASHGYEHRLVYQQTPLEFATDITKTKLLLEDISGQEVIGYRAPNFSITNACPWAYQELAKANYKYDSSIYPIKHPRYSNADKPLAPYDVETPAGRIIVFPLAVLPLSLGKYTLHLPAAGGAYWRLFPLGYTKWALKKINASQDRGNVCYFHPWELDDGQPYFSALPLLARFRHYHGIGGMETKLEKLLTSFAFAPLADYYAMVGAKR